jgi:hypothetical protein
MGAPMQCQPSENPTWAQGMATFFGGFNNNISAEAFISAKRLPM